MFDLDHFVADCREAVRGENSHKAVEGLVANAVADPAALMKAIGEPTESGLFPIYSSPTLTVMNLVWKPEMTIMPHNHEMWAMIGIYGGREDNIFWRRKSGDPDGRIEAAGARALGTSDVAPMGKDIIHSVTNPIPKLTGALHVYGGDFLEAERSEWDAEHLTEHPYDMSKVRAMFAAD